MSIFGTIINFNLRGQEKLKKIWLKIILLHFEEQREKLTNQKRFQIEHKIYLINILTSYIESKSS